MISFNVNNFQLLRRSNTRFQEKLLRTYENKEVQRIR